MKSADAELPPWIPAGAEAVYHHLTRSADYPKAIDVLFRAEALRDFWTRLFE